MGPTDPVTDYPVGGSYDNQIFPNLRTVMGQQYCRDELGNGYRNNQGVPRDNRKKLPKPAIRFPSPLRRGLVSVRYRRAVLRGSYSFRGRNSWIRHAHDRDTFPTHVRDPSDGFRTRDMGGWFL